jgi:hypothetical protein
MTVNVSCGVTALHDPHRYFTGWPRREAVCGGQPARTRALTLAEQLVVKASDDVFIKLLDYLEGQRDAVTADLNLPDTPDGERWSSGYLTGINDALSHVQFLRGELGGR